jgi:hypothetical protein
MITFVSKSILFVLWVCRLFVFQCCTTTFEAQLYVIVGTPIMTLLTFLKTAMKRFVFGLVSYPARLLILYQSNAKIQVSS